MIIGLKRKNYGVNCRFCSLFLYQKTLQVDILVTLYKYHSGDQVKKTEMGRTCGTYGGEERCMQGFSGETWGKETTWKTQA
jgi:hypothetical protein